MKKKKIIITMFFYFFLVLVGLLQVSNNLPKFVKDRTNFKVYCTMSPFNLRFETKKYVMYINKKVFFNIQNKSIKIINDVKENINTLIE